MHCWGFEEPAIEIPTPRAIILRSGGVVTFSPAGTASTFPKRNEPGFPKLRWVFRQGEMRWPKDQSWLWRWSGLSFRHSVPPLRAAPAPAVHRPASERRPGPRDLEYEAMGGPSSPGQRRILLQAEAPISPHPKRIRYRHQMRFRRTRGTTRNSRVLKCS